MTFDGQNFTYDATGQAATASYSGYLLQQYYDGNGLRVKKTESGATTYYLRSSVLGEQVVAEINANGAWQRGYVYLGGQLVAVQQQNAVYWVHQDPVAKSKRVTNGSGNVVSTVELDPWGGNTNRNNNDAFQPHKFTNYERDGNASDEAMFRRYNRWYSKFDQPDPYEGSYNLADPQSFNRYAYVQNDPVNLVDPTGLEPCIWDPSTGNYCVYGGGDPIRPIDDPTTYRFVLASSWNPLVGGQLGGGRGGGTQGGAGVPQNPALPPPHPINLTNMPTPPPPPTACGVNPITGQPGFTQNPVGQPGHLRAPVNGRGEFGAPSDGRQLERPTNDN
jgi:RHS repeat-associated protein